MGDVRLLRILAIDPGTISAYRSGDVAAVNIRFGLCPGRCCGPDTLGSDRDCSKLVLRQRITR